VSGLRLAIGCRQNPISALLAMHLGDFDNVVTFEEQYGGFGNSIIEAMSSYGKKTRIFKRALPNRGIYENGTRDELLDELWMRYSY